MTRREFGTLTAAAAAAATMRTRGAAAAPPPLAPMGADERVAVVGVSKGAPAADVMAAVRRAAEVATDFSWLSRGDTVLIKPSVNSGNVYPATTDPLALRAMIELLREKGAGRVIVADMSGVQVVRFHKDATTGSTRELMRTSGIESAILDSGAELHAFEEPGWDAFYAERPTHGDAWAQEVILPKVLQSVDHVVLLPRCSRHVMASTTLGLKCAVGWWRHDARLHFHRDATNFAEKIAQANTVPTMLEKQRLILTSATRVMATFGPDQGRVVEPDTGLILASESIVAHDMVSFAWLLDVRRLLPDDEKNNFPDDPQAFQATIELTTRLVTFWLGGLANAWKAQAYDRWDLDTVWGDHVMRAAFQAFGGIPRVELVDDGGTVPQVLRAAIEKEITVPAVA